MKKAGRREKVILMTGRPVDPITLNGDVPPVFTMLEKPFHIHNFLDVVSSALARPPKKGRGKKRGVKGKGGQRRYRCSIN